MKKEDLRKIKEYFKKNKAIGLAYLYGSQARGEAKESSDIDLAILVDKKKGDDFKIQLQAMADLSRLINKEVEVQNLHAVDVPFAKRVISEGKLIFSRRLEDKVAYETYILRQYFDLGPFYNEFYGALAERARQGLIGHLIT